MLRRFSVILSLMLVTSFAMAPAVLAGRQLQGQMELAWNDGWSGPSTTVPDWVGTIDFGDGEVYPMAFFNIGTGKHPNHAPAGKAAFFEEYWAVYARSVVPVWNGTVFVGFDPDEEPLLYGYDRGQFNAQTGKYHMSGYVIDADGPFDKLDGRRVTMKGTIGPDGATAPGVLRIH